MAGRVKRTQEIEDGIKDMLAKKAKEGKTTRPRWRVPLEPAWHDYIRRHWTLPIGMMAGRSRREVCQRSILARRDALGRQMSPKVGTMLIGMTDRSGGTLSGNQVIKVIIDPGAMRTLLDHQTAVRNDIGYRWGLTMRFELANGTILTPMGEIVKQESIELRGVSVNMKLLVVKSHSACGILLGRDWLRRVSAAANYGEMVYHIRAYGKQATIKQNRGSCEMLSAGEEELDSSEESTDESNSDELEESDYLHVAQMAMVIPLDGYQAKARTIATPSSLLGTLYASPKADCLLGDVGPGYNRNDGIVDSHNRLDSEFNIRVDLTSAQWRRVMELLNRYPTTFATELDHLESTDLIGHQVHVKPGAKPVYQLGNKGFA